MKIKHAITIEPGSTITLGGIKGATLNGNDVSVNDNILDINAATAVKLNDTTYNVDSQGVIDLGNISTGGGSEPNNANLHISLNNTSLGNFTANSSTDTSVNINACTKVKVNGTTIPVNSSGQVNLPNSVSAIQYWNALYTADAYGGVSLPTKYIQYSSPYGGPYSGTSAFSNATSWNTYLHPYFYMTADVISITDSTPKFYTISSTKHNLHLIFSSPQFTYVDVGTYSYQFDIQVISDCVIDFWVTVGKHYTSAPTSAVQMSVLFGEVAYENRILYITSGKNGRYGGSDNILAANGYVTDNMHVEGSDTPPNSIYSFSPLQSVAGMATYRVSGEIVNDIQTSFSFTRIDSTSGQANDGVLTLNLNNTSIGQFTANQSLNTSINVNACTSITVNSSTYNVDSQGVINLGNISGATQKSSIYGTPLCANATTNYYNNYTTPVVFLEHLHKAQNFATQGLHINFTNGSFYMKWRVTNFSVTSVSPLSFDATLRLSVTSDVNTDNMYTLYPILDVWTQNNTFVGCYVFGLPSDKSQTVANYALYENYSTESNLPQASVTDNTTSIITNVSTFSGIPLTWGTKDYVLSMSVSNNVASTYQITTI